MKYENRIESTPFCVIYVEGNPGGVGPERGNDYRVEMYWTKNAGTYGHQVVTYVFPNGPEESTADITSGCGYCKEATAFEWAVKEITGKRSGKHDRADRLLWDQWQGGDC